MKISKKSWHYAIVKDRDGSVPKSLCGYFWNLVGSLLLLGLFTFAGILFFILLPYQSMTSEVGLGNKLFGFIGWFIVAFIAFVIFGIDFIIKKKNSMLLQYLKAVKDKHCPLIEYTDE